MGDRLRSLMGKSSSKLGIMKGSVNHIGTTPYKYKVSLFVSHVDGINTAGEVCVTMERHGKNISTAVVKVKDKKAVFRETISMETTLFRRQSPGSKSGNLPPTEEDIKFDEKIAKIALRKSGADGKALGKIHMNLADYIKGPTGTVFADIKLNNDAIIVSKIESELLQIGKRKKTGEDESDAFSDTTEKDAGMDDDSVFGEYTADKEDLDLMIEDAKNVQGTALTTNSPSKKSLSRQTPLGNLNSERPAAGTTLIPSPITNGKPFPEAVKEDKGATTAGQGSRSESNLQTMNGSSHSSISSSESNTRYSAQISTDQGLSKPVALASDSQASPSDDAGLRTRKDKMIDDRNSGGIVESSSLRNKIKSRLKRDKTQKSEGSSSENKGESETSPTAVSQSAFANHQQSAAAAVEIAELRQALEAAQNENKKLKASRQALLAENSNLRVELDAATNANAHIGADDSVPDGRTGKMRRSEGEIARNPGGNAELASANKAFQERIRQLESHIENLQEELEQNYQQSREAGGTSGLPGDAVAKMRTYKRRIEELEIALRREPHYLDVVDELKVTKMALALANMEREQAKFTLKQYESAAASNHHNNTGGGWALF